ncbi:hypothetical protein [Microbacterium sp. IEGM 1404]|uniref:hypothetical protein n=1 Tax=Microbacterium sp. IEGM 1404 TaxID=3047084 RepID=UPI0024B75682|nr:hypothetical protein [Microbacterium sp. IEGM 1404]MDI9891705.1 hypothetical protein [Microbacterium sp. IEGM 1404]
MSQLQRSSRPGVWFIYDKSTRIAIVRVVCGRKLLRSVTFDADPARRQLIGYFPEDAMRLAVECAWSEYVRATGPSTSNRR